jgi:hypothetical protein
MRRLMDQAHQHHQPQPAEQAERSGEHQRRVLAALRSARRAHQRAIDLHEQAAALFERLGERSRAEQARQAADRERDRLRQADHKLAAAVAGGHHGPPAPDRTELDPHAPGRSLPDGAAG